MRFIKLANNNPDNYSLEQLFEEYPNAVIYKNSQMPNSQLLANYDVYPLITTPMPDEAEVMVIGEGTPEFKDTEWYQTWSTRPYTAEEMAQKQQIQDVEAQSLVSKGLFQTAAPELSKERYDICKECDRFFSLTTTCKECGCFMIAKTKMASAKCPLGKW